MKIYINEIMNDEKSDNMGYDTSNDMLIEDEKTQ